ncbi:polysaccharide pyruvyl transferase family protein [Acetobacterium wieringae]|uniref:polysaccharide pyruvyl transferase family protein n=1 Tax=Acetobacterium wieringae TaxID=52694 RepID=UPI0020333DBC|nr:polysaccharide pyruvyl transferase family protein [Acetobacterium wieringae]URN84112.1 polysaccharide pyruvyl transferase family protein [Acetobacterium wieringae]
MCRERAFNKFDVRFIKYSKYWLNNKKHRELLDSQYDYFVCGSDQIWNPSTYNFGSNNFAMFATSTKKVTMAPSFGVTDFPKEREKEFRECLNTFKYVSVREVSGTEIVKTLTGKEAEVTIDPTLMIDKDTWRIIAQKPAWLKDGNYILCYTLGMQYMNDWVNDLAKQYDSNVINLMDNSYFDYYTTDPAGFLYLIDNCKLMITDSFHGSIFAIVFDRPLVVMERKDEYVSMNTRLDNMLHLFDLEDRRYSNVVQTNQFMKHSYCHTYEIIREEQKKGNEFLQKSFG